MVVAWELPNRAGEEESEGCPLMMLAMQVVHVGREPCKRRLGGRSDLLAGHAWGRERKPGELVTHVGCCACRILSGALREKKRTWLGSWPGGLSCEDEAGLGIGCCWS